MLDAVMFGHSDFQPVIQAIIKLAEKAAKEPWDFEAPDKAKYADKVKALAEADLREAFATAEKQKRHEMVEGQGQGDEGVAARRRGSPRGGSLGARHQGARSRRSFAARSSDAASASTAAISKTVRPILSEVHVLPRTHGSALFTRGETQALVVATLGTGEDEQYVDGLEGTHKERFLLHYNFPPYSVGETGRWARPAAAKSATASSPGAR